MRLDGHRRRGSRAAALAIAALMLLGGAAWATPAEAGGRHHKHHRHHPAQFKHHGHKGHGFHGRRGHGHRRFVVPHRIHRRHHAHYRPYFYGRIYDRPHRHHHVVYHFPVYTDYGLEYRPHYYCGSRLYARGYFELGTPRLRVAVGY